MTQKPKKTTSKKVANKGGSIVSTKNAVKATSTTGGFLVGSYAGAAAGFAIGGPIGGVVGFLLGSSGGAGSGYKLSDKVTKKWK